MKSFISRVQKSAGTPTPSRFGIRHRMAAGLALIVAATSLTIVANIGSANAATSCNSNKTVGEKAVCWAKTQIGVPYVYGAESAGHGFDCSGLTEWSYRQAGYNITRTTYSQWDIYTRPEAWRVGLPTLQVSELQIGDLVFFNGKEHVGMYVGNGNVINAPHTGEKVKIEPISWEGSLYGAIHVQR